MTKSISMAFVFIFFSYTLFSAMHIQERRFMHHGNGVFDTMEEAMSVAWARNLLFLCL